MPAPPLSEIIDPTSQIQRIRSAARVVVALAESNDVAELGQRACALSRTHLGVDAAALFLGHDPPNPVARLGFALDPPDGVPGSLAPLELDRFRAWALGAGFRRVELAPITIDRHPAGLLALLSVSPGPTLESSDLETLGAGLALAIEHLRSNSELVRAYAKQNYFQEERVRSERLRALGEMALGIAHDINNVLNAILTQAGVLGELGVEGDLRVHALDRLRQSALAGAATVGRLQEFSRQRRDQDFGELDLAALVNEAISVLAERAGARVRVLSEIKGSARVHGEAGELLEAILAIGENAIEASADGATVTLRLERLVDQARLSVLDSGPGMSREIRKRAFDPFFTTKGTRKKGLGLSLAYGIARRHGGRIEIDSSPRKGTRVELQLPCLPIVEAPKSPPPVPASTPRTGKRRVLLVEDDLDNRDALATLLELSGYEVTTAASGSAGVKAFRGALFDVVLTDLGLPDIDGWQVAGEVKATQPETPVALITGWGFNLDRSEIQRRGVDLLVKKPIDPNRFLDQIETLVGSAQS